MKRLFTTSLRARLTGLVLIAVLIPVLVAMAFVGVRVTELLRQNAEQELKLRALSLVESVSQWDEATVLALRNLSRQPDITGMVAEQQKPVLTNMLDVYTHMYLVSTTDLNGMNVARSDDQELIDYADRPWFLGAKAGNDITRQTLLSRTNNQPGVCFSTPVQGDSRPVEGVAVACTSLTVLAEQVGAVRLGETGFAYLVDEQGQVLAHPDPTFVSELRDLSAYPPVKALQSSQSGALSFFDEDNEDWLAHIVPLTNGWGVVVQQRESEVFAEINEFWQLMLITTLIVVVAVGAFTWLAANRIVRPIVDLTRVATAIAGGQIDRAVTIEQADEVGVLARAFNQMAAQLRELISSLEQRVADRTHRLEISANLAEQLTAILNLEELLAEVVNQVKENFGYYHAHIYLVDDAREKLVVAAGTGQAGEQMKAMGHNISLNAPTSLVARAARSGQVVNVDNVRVAEDWLPNPLLPDTYSEMAVPITLEGNVVGVLDVQQDEVAGLDEGDANLLRSLANQVAVAIRNARLFAEVETSLAEARAAQQRYVQQAWRKSKVGPQQSQYMYAQPEAPPLDEAKRQALAEARRRMWAESSTAVVSLDENDKQRALVAPIHLRDEQIGALQLYTARPDYGWSDDDLAVIEAVADQLAQTAEGLRLFDETRQRADYERLAGEITEKLRQAPTLDALAKTAAEALGNALGVSHSLVNVGATPSPPPGDTTGSGKQG